MPPKKLRNTKAKIIEVNYNDLVEGKYYIIQHKKEGLSTITERYTDAPGRFVTRFRGKFVQLNVGKSGRNPQGLPSGLPHGIEEDQQVALFENVEIVLNPTKRNNTPKTEFTDDVYILRDYGETPDRSFSLPSYKFIFFNQVNDLKKKFNNLKEDLNKYTVAFSTGTWSFGEIYQKLTDEDRLTQIQTKYDNDEIDNPSKRSAFELGKTVFDPRTRPGGEIGSFLGVQPPPPDPSLDFLRNPYPKGGRSYRRRKNRSHKKSRKRRTMKNRYHGKK